MLRALHALLTAEAGPASSSSVLDTLCTSSRWESALLITVLGGAWGWTVGHSNSSGHANTAPITQLTQFHVVLTLTLVCYLLRSEASKSKDTLSCVFTLGVCASDHTSKRDSVSWERCAPCTRCCQRKRGGQTALLFLIRCAHPRVQYLALLPVYWVFGRKRSQAWDDWLSAPLVQKFTGLVHFFSSASELML